MKHVLSALLKTSQNSDQSATNHALFEGVRFVRSARAKRLSLRVDHKQGDICLVVPKRVSERRAWDFAAQNADWIEGRLERLRACIPFKDGARIPIFGKERVLRIEPKISGITQISLSECTLYVRTPRADATRNIELFLKKELIAYAQPLATEKASQIHKRITALSLRDTHTRWGSCGLDGRMMLSWRLVFAPKEVIDYVVAHEVAHLKHLDHSPKFWALCKQLAENMDYGHGWLSDNGAELLKIGKKSPLETK